MGETGTLAGDDSTAPTARRTRTNSAVCRGGPAHPRMPPITRSMPAVRAAIWSRAAHRGGRFPLRRLTTIQDGPSWRRDLLAGPTTTEDPISRRGASGTASLPPSVGSSFAGVRSGASATGAAVQQQPQAVVGEVAEAVPDPLGLPVSRLTASVGPLEPPVACQARISASQALTARAGRDSSATPTQSTQ